MFLFIGILILWLGRFGRSQCAHILLPFLHHGSFRAKRDFRAFSNPHHRKSECRKNHHPSEGLQDTGEPRNI
ncbi:hypothetical protein BD769DRAFT_1483804 [Suillus cothurnatus]|nr:hypothetical protein BD769DRAFT_1483804 [Suillus cothurnatus]